MSPLLLSLAIASSPFGPETELTMRIVNSQLSRCPDFTISRQIGSWVLTREADGKRLRLHAANFCRDSPSVVSMTGGARFIFMMSTKEKEDERHVSKAVRTVVVPGGTCADIDKAAAAFLKPDPALCKEAFHPAPPTPFDALHVIEPTLSRVGRLGFVDDPYLTGQAHEFEWLYRGEQWRLGITAHCRDNPHSDVGTNLSVTVMLRDLKKTRAKEWSAFDAAPCPKKPSSMPLALREKLTTIANELVSYANTPPAPPPPWPSAPQPSPPAYVSSTKRSPTLPAGPIEPVEGLKLLISKGGGEIKAASPGRLTTLAHQFDFRFGRFDWNVGFDATCDTSELTLVLNLAREGTNARDWRKKTKVTSGSCNDSQRELRRALQELSQEVVEFARYASQ